MRYGESETLVVPAFVKLAKNAQGRAKLLDEIAWYRAVRGLRVPDVINWNPLTLANVFGRPAEPSDAPAIIDALREFHAVTMVNGDPTEMIRYELYHKVKTRYELTGVPAQIKTVNGVELPRFEDALEFMRTVKIPKSHLCMIHGDPHLGNVLMDYGPVFIDPRGRFGGKQLYGVPEYDFAKVHLSLTGYSDLEQCEPIPVTNHMTIPFRIHTGAFAMTPLTKLLLASIWLANAPGFSDHRWAISHYYALYIFKITCSH